MPYDTLKDLVPISQIGMQHMIIAANPSFPANNIPELIALAKKNPGQYSYASSGAGTALHLSFELFKVKAGLDITHVPYKGGAPAQQDVMGGQVPLLVDIYQSSAPLIKSGRLKLIGLFSPKPSPDVPGGVPVADTVPGVSSMSIFGLVGPAGMPPEIVDKISQDIARLSKSADWMARMHELGVVPVGSTPAEFDALIRSDIAKWAPIVKASGATAD
jgi:tripartite-type tricarboxylate transporter receptor subunit TctC